MGSTDMAVEGPADPDQRLFDPDVAARALDGSEAGQEPGADTALDYRPHNSTEPGGATAAGRSEPVPKIRPRRAPARGPTS
ncbi:hypothetical protein [Streptomyces sp. NPDC046925]|uniref:hypothetical protein n=1 Tax=Streptomyces sp. NPDC046925 TaxID=3155375 RepID=UPI003408169C